MREPQLDGVRAVSIAAVFFSHFWYEGTYAFGVRLSFVLSGFLITKILLGIKEQGWAGVRDFYARRAVRIWPIYYLTLLAVIFLKLAFDVGEISLRSLAFHAVFLSNFWYALVSPEYPWPLIHLWSLSVQEQFYLIWPVVILLVPARSLAVLCWSLILLAIPIRIWTEQNGILYLPSAAMDALAVGALLAVRGRAGGRLSGWLWWPGVTALLTALIIQLLRLEVSWSSTIMASAFLLLFAPLVDWASRGQLPSVLGTWLSANPVTAFGRISFGAYLYHLPVFAVIISMGGAAGVTVERGPALFVVAGALSIAIAAVSWIVIERPLLERLPHRKKVLAPSLSG